ncbi:MAG: group 1 truncated hemoglobin [Planctomycetales bacterium]|nr:group 1 truncated hemoglobin [Planctomycetales bacterium]
MAESLYTRLGGFDAIAAVADNLLPRLMADEQLGRFWQHRGEDGIRREKQLLVDFLCQSAGGPMYYTGRNMELAHGGMAISEADWTRFIGHLTDTLAHFNLADQETKDVLDFVASTKSEIVEER